eukprot:1331813-Rhodomonas_salina.3
MEMRLFVCGCRARLGRPVLRLRAYEYESTAVFLGRRVRELGCVAGLVPALDEGLDRGRAVLSSQLPSPYAISYRTSRSTRVGGNVPLGRSSLQFPAPGSSIPELSTAHRTLVTRTAVLAAPYQSVPSTA